MAMAPPPRQKLWIWFLWLAAFYGVWLTLIVTGNHWQTLKDHWGIAVAMAAGSYVAGSSFAVQSIGMVSAGIFILSRRLRIEWTILGGAMTGSLIGTPLGILFVAPYIPGVWVKVIFAVVWGSFGVLHLYRTREFARAEGMAPRARAFDWRAGLALGFLSGMTVVAVTGVGIDMMIYAVLVLLRRADLKIAVPTSVMIMAFNSVVGIAFKNLTTGVLPGVYENWLAAAPIVALGAPLGVFVVQYIGRAPTLYFVAVLCIGQFGWTMQDEWAHLGYSGLALALGGIVAFNVAFEWLYRLGRDKMPQRELAPAAVPAPVVACDTDGP
jgi:uncharacterized protein